MEENKYKFCNDTDKREAYTIAKIQFKKIINNFNEKEFKCNFDELFESKKNHHKLFLKDQDNLICGTLSFLYKNNAFVDIFFWNQIFLRTNSKIFRFFCERFFEETQKIGIENMIVPMEKSRIKHESFKKYCQKLYFTKEKYNISDTELKNEYKNHYLLKVNYKNYYEQKWKITNSQTKQIIYKAI